MCKNGLSWRRVSLRFLFIGVGVLATGLSVLSWYVRSLEREQRLASQLMSKRIAVEYECERDERGFQTRASRFETSMSAIFGLDHFDHVVMINVPRMVALDHELEALSTFTELRGLWIAERHVSDAEIASAARCQKLEYMGWSAVTVSDVGFSQIGSLPRLRNFGLSDMKISSSALESTSRLPELQVLSLIECTFETGALESLANCRKLQTLSLVGSVITDDDLAPVGSLPELRSLDLEQTAITDVGLTHVAKISTLEWLGIYNAWVTKEGVAELREALPNCRIKVQRTLASRSTE